MGSDKFLLLSDLIFYTGTIELVLIPKEHLSVRYLHITTLHITTLYIWHAELCAQKPAV
jgi:hypothetical protein